MSAHDQKQVTAIAPQRQPSITLTPEQFERLRDTLAAYGGVYLDSAQQRMLEAGLARRLAATGDDLERYQRRVTTAGGREELRRLAEQILNHETFFFRNQPHLRALREVLLPEIHRRKPAGEPIRLWSAGCATGEEPYSLAIAAFEALGRTGRTFEVYGTDLSETALAKARAGFYRGRSLNNVAPELLERFFRPHQDGYQVSETLRGVVQFAQLNLLEPFPEFVRGCDAIFCQNVTIYFRAEARRELIGRFYEWLPPGGLLFLGFSETLWNVFDHFRTRQVAGAYVYCKEPSDAARRPEGMRLAPPRRRAIPAADARKHAAGQRPRMTAGVPAERGAPAPRSADSQSDAGILASSRALLDEGRVAEALELLRAIPPKSPIAAQALTLVAQAHADRGNLEQAVAEVRRAIEIEALNDEAYLLLGVIYGRQGEWLAAARELERARYLQPEAPLVSFHLADAYRHTGRAELAAREYRSALRKLAHHPPERLLGGVAVSWLRETCERQLENLLQP
jgi:chemotaxis protein methyltransferase CheR